MKLRAQIFSGYALLALLVAVVSVAGYIGLKAVSGSFNVAINETQPVLTALHDIRLQATHLAFTLAARAADAQEDAKGSAARDEERESPNTPEGLRTRLTAAVSAYHGLVERYFPDELAKTEEIFRRTEHFLAASDALAALDVRGQHAAFEASIGRVATSLDALRDAVDEAAGEEEGEFAGLRESIDTDLRRHLLAILGTCVLSLIAAIAGGAALATHISRPIHALQEAADQLGRGHLDTHVDVTTDNELGTLQSRFNAMAEDLAHSLVSRDYVEAIIESMAEGVVVVDAEGRIERSNSAMKRLYDEAAQGPMLGRPLHEVFAVDDQKDLGSDRASRRGFECRLRGPQEPPTIVSVSVSPITLATDSRGRVLVVQDITERKRNEERLSYLASYDVLTGLPNRRMFLDHLRATLARLPWNGQHVGIMFCDLDRFKFVNDSLGHNIGDLLLQRITERIREVLRPGDVVGRWAGDEFVVMLDEIAQPRDIDIVAEKLVERLRQPVQIGPHELHITVSVGTACAPTDSLDAEELVKSADLAMYTAKAAGKNNFIHYAPEMRTRTEMRLMLEHALRSALDVDDQLQAYYQAQQTFDGTVIGFEALVRWQHPQMGLISPAQFLPAAAEAGLMAALDESVLRMACAELRRWREAGWRDLRVAVNLSNQSFRRSDLVEVVARTVDAAGVPRDRVELELTEDIVMENVGSAIETMERLCALGVHLSIDDFGTGYSSLGQLKRCPIQLLKIDRSFVMDVTHDESDRAITNAIIALAHKLGIKVLAEGVETQEQLDVLRVWGCDAMQGYLLSKPLPAEAANAWLAARQG
ncbi:bifunctional diguanylate cyclase/phosphodiesterase [Azoarcus sp. KH32C]|uniref:putative bifunctional diguanylate cyclase/phosphodiesterase n=1 Tax=Azoarcus sp. KH32C TaxID=748247 RepID=UPI00023867E0|nr:EAL domain-containing protein [Azoarcus sp. KH32C]BAL22634.1 response regulator receiver modulated diguanylate cyclase/phosphodiesterase with PAS/PAC sensor [Azoarcus sp. KH32C]